MTKRIHNQLHGWEGDGDGLGDEERRIYEATLAGSADALARALRPGDVVFLHDPQTGGLVEHARARGATVVWRCHVGLDLPNDLARSAWEFLRPYVESADAYVFSRREFAWEGLDSDRTWIVAPSIDAFSPKNQDLTTGAVAAILATAGIGTAADDESPLFTRVDGTPGRVDSRAEVVQARPLDDAAVIAQVSRWDRLKDPAGVMRFFAEHCADLGADLLLAGPSVAAVADDPEGAGVLKEVLAQREALPEAVRDRVHLAALPMDDVEENAAIVNAIQRRSQVIVQKSLAEGFGLTVAEAMWKGRPVVASGLGGIQDQIVDGESGVLIDDPDDLEAFAAACRALLSDPERAAAMGEAARERVRLDFLGTRHLVQYLELLEGPLAA